MRVLLIEDDSATAQSIELMLKSESFNVYTTDLGEEGVDLGKLYDYDIILLDLNLPDMSGYEVLRTLRLSKVKTPILILSGMAGIEDKVKGLGFGADDYLTKPFHKDELVAHIHAIVRRSKGHAQSVITTADLVVNLDTKTVEVGAARVHLTRERAARIAGALRRRTGGSPPPTWRPSCRGGPPRHRRVARRRRRPRLGAPRSPGRCAGSPARTSRSRGRAATEG